MQFLNITFSRHICCDNLCSEVILHRKWARKITDTSQSRDERKSTISALCVSVTKMYLLIKTPLRRLHLEKSRTLLMFTGAWHADLPLQYRRTPLDGVPGGTTAAAKDGGDGVNWSMHYLLDMAVRN